MAGAYLAYRNLFDDPSVTITPDAFTTINPDFPESNLKLRQLSSVCKLTQPTIGNSALITLDTSGIGEINFIAFLGEWVPSEINVDGVLSGVTNYITAGGTSSVLDIPSAAVFTIPLEVITSIEVLFPVEAPNEAVFSRIYIAQAIELDLGVKGGWRLGADDSGSLEASEGRQWYENKGVVTRRLNVSVDLADTTTAFGLTTDSSTSEIAAGHLQDMQMHVGQTGEVFVVPRTRTAIWKNKLGVHGHLASPLEISHLSGENYSSSFTVIEER
jgi:hypothetical protein